MVRTSLKLFTLEVGNINLGSCIGFCIAVSLFYLLLFKANHNPFALSHLVSWIPTLTRDEQLIAIGLVPIVFEGIFLCSAIFGAIIGSRLYRLLRHYLHF